MTNDEKLIIKLALLADWQYLCHDDFEEGEDMDEDQYWAYLQEKSDEQLSQMAADDFDADRPAERVLELYASYLSHKYQDLMPVKP